MTPKSPAATNKDDKTSPRDEAAAARALDRAAGDLRRGWPVLLDCAADGLVVIASPETMSADAFDLVATLADSRGLSLIVTAERAASLGMTATSADPVALAFGKFPDAKILRALADPTSGPVAVPAFAASGAKCAPDAMAAALSLARRARLLPAVAAAFVAAETARERRGIVGTLADSFDLLTVKLSDAVTAGRGADGPLALAAEARLPLAGAEDARIFAFRSADGGPDHIALVIGSPDRGAPVLTRIHSECITGDLLGSLRCDCGQQLDGAIRAIAAAGSGILIYLAQEGRGIGLLNKLRSYQIQDQGVDTIDANECLGFAADERLYWPAASILKRLGFGVVRLLTNNPAKVEALTRHGIAVAERVPHAFPANGHNDGYLRAKARRAGHLL